MGYSCVIQPRGKLVRVIISLHKELAHCVHSGYELQLALLGTPSVRLFNLCTTCHLRDLLRLLLWAGQSVRNAKQDTDCKLNHSEIVG